MNTEPMRFYIRSTHIGCVAQFRFAEDVSLYLSALSGTDTEYDLWTVYDRTVLLGTVPEVIEFTVSEISHGKRAA